MTTYRDATHRAHATSGREREGRGSAIEPRRAQNNWAGSYLEKAGIPASIRSESGDFSAGSVDLASQVDRNGPENIPEAQNQLVRHEPSPRLGRALELLREINRARYIGQRGAADLLSESLEQLDALGGFTAVRAPAPSKSRPRGNPDWRYSLDRLQRYLGRYSLLEQIEGWENEGGAQ